MSFDQAQPAFGLNDCKVAAYTATNSYGTAADIHSIQAMNVTTRMMNAELTGDDQITATASFAIAGQATIRFGGVSVTALEVMLGITATSSVASPNNIKTFRVAAGSKTPYFGLVGKAIAAEGLGQTEFWIPKCKIMSDFTLQMEYGNFSIPEVTVAFVKDDTFNLWNIILAEATRSLAIPPVNIPTS